MIKKILKIFVFLLLLLFIGITIFFLTFDINRYRERIATKVTEALGRTVSIGKIELKVSLIPTIILKDVQLANAPWSKSEKPMVQIDSMNVSFAFIPLFQGDFEMKDFLINQMSVRLEKQGEYANWQLMNKENSVQADTQPSETPQPVQNKKLPAFTADQIAVNSMNVIYQNGSDTQTIYLSNAVVQQLKAFSGELIYGGRVFKASGTVDNILNWLIAKPNYSFEINLDAFNTLFALSGTIGNTEQLKDIYVNVQLSGSDFNALMQSFGKMPTFPRDSYTGGFMLRGDLQRLLLENVTFDVAGGKSLSLNASGVLADLTEKPVINISADMAITSAKFADSLKIKPFSLSVDANILPNEVMLDKVVFYAGKSDVTGQASVALTNGKPHIMATLSSEYFSLTDLIPETAEEQTPRRASSQTQEMAAAPKKIFSDQALDLTALKNMDATVSLNFKNMDVGSDLTEYVAINTKAQLKDSVLTIAPLNLAALGGTTSGHITVSAQKEAHIELALFSQNLQSDSIKSLQPILRDVRMNSVVNLKSTGNSLKALMSHLNGTVSAEILSGSIISPVFNSLPLPAMVIRNQVSPVAFSTSDQVSKIICGAVNMTVKNGVIQLNKNIALETSTVNFVVSGDVNLANETLSLSMQPSVSAAASKVTNQVLSLSQAVKISGPFTALKPSLDAASVSKTVAKAGLDILLKDKGVRVDQEAEPYALCEKALGRSFPKPEKTSAQQPAVVQEAAPAPAPATEPVSFKDQFKRDLLNSLSKALSE